MVTHYFARLRHNDQDDQIMELVVVRPTDPHQKVYTARADPTDPSGVRQIPGLEWPKHWAGSEVLVFRAAEDYVGGPIAWVYDRRQVVERMTEERQKAFFLFVKD